MKSIKKLFAVGLAVMMALSIPFSVSAAELEDAPIDESRTGSLDPSHVLLAIGRVHDVAHGSLRLSLCEYNTDEEVDHILKVVPEVVQYLRNMSPVWRDLQEGKRQYIL